MHFRGLDLNLLVVLDALLTEKNTTRAGEIVCLGQSATSAALSRLREFFGDPILVRSGSKMVLTPLAQELIQPVRHILKETETVANCNTKFAPGTSSRVFKLNMSDYVTTVMLPSIMKQVKEVAPGVKIDMRFFTGSSAQVGGNLPVGDELRSYLEQGDVDFLIVAKNFMCAQHPNEELFVDRFACVVWSGNQRVKKSISLEQFLSLSHVVVRLGPHETHTLVDLAVQEAGFERNIELVVSTFNLAPHAVIGTDLVTVMHSELAKYHQKYLPIKVLPLPIEVPPITMHMQWHRYHDHDPGTTWFRNILRHAAKEIFRPTVAQVEPKLENSPASAMKDKVQSRNGLTVRPSQIRVG